MIQPTGKVKVTPTELRRMLKDSGIFERIRSGELREVLGREGHPARTQIRSAVLHPQPDSLIL